jgi:hypothetical protein
MAPVATDKCTKNTAVRTAGGFLAPVVAGTESTKVRKAEMCQA